MDVFLSALNSHTAGDLPSAIRLYRVLLERAPLHAAAWDNLGTALKATGDLVGAEECVRRAISIAPNDANPYYNLGNTLRVTNRAGEAIDAYRRALALNPNFAAAHYNLGLTLENCGRTTEACDAYTAAVAADPHHYEARLNLGSLLESGGLLSQAMALHESATRIDPVRCGAWNNLGLVFQSAGRIDDALLAQQRALELAPAEHRIASNLLMALQYKQDVTDSQLRSIATQYGERFPPLGTKVVRSAVGRRLRVGYVSADFGQHVVGLFLRDVLPNHDASAFHVFCYHNGRTRDSVTEHLGRRVNWRDIADLSDEAVTRLVEQDEIDILVDLSGHTSGNRLPVFAHRVAPVQITWLGYFGTTGLPAMDFVLLDPYHAPDGTEAQFTERVMRLPNNRFCFSPVPFAPAVMPPPFRRNGYVTFGCFNNTAKLNHGVLDTWAKLLAVVPDSRLILKWKTFSDEEFRERIAGFFVERGIAAERLELRRHGTHRQLLEEYAHIDIALDPFPFSGGHTSCEALWMGVPVVTLPQQRVVSRQTWSFLNNIGLPGLAAPNAEAYILLASKLAKSPETLDELRQTLRERMRQSPLCDVPRFIRDLEQAYRAAWQAITNEALAVWSARDDSELLHCAALDAWQRGDAEAARMHLHSAIAQNPNVAAYHANLGVVLKQQGTGEERIACYHRALELAPDEALYHANLAGALSDLGRYKEAEQHARRAVALDGTRAESWFNLGSALAGLARWADASEAFEEAANHRPRWVAALKASGESRRAAGSWLEAGRRFLQALESLPPEAAVPERIALLRELGNCQVQLYRYAGAEECYRSALALDGSDVELLTDLGNTLKAQGKFDEAAGFYERVVTLRPELAGGHSNLGTIAQSTGDYEKAIESFRRAVSLAPQLGPAWGNLGVCLSYSPRHSPADVLEAFRQFDAQVGRPVRDPRPFLNVPDPARRLRVGYLSPDFRRHPVAYFALPLVEGHVHQNVEVFCYYNHLQNDDWTDRFRERADAWRICTQMSDQDLSDQIRADGIDVLVDLTGHTEGNRLLVFARKPAPVQVTWMGYVTTTGLSTMDWRVTHEDADPTGMELYYSEKLWRLKGTMWCYRPLASMPKVSPPPFESAGRVTFGALNRYSKVSIMVLEAWASILQRVEGSQLVICVPEGSVRANLLSFMSSRGIDEARIRPFNKLSHENFWALHGEIDVALDPFPFGGGTTTCETLWLGVPVVTVTGTEGGDFAPRFASRMGAAFLKNIGLPELVASSVPEYIDTAVNLAMDHTRLATLRKTLRSRMAAAPLTDEARFVREMEEAYRGMWNAWCDTAGQTQQLI